MTFIPTPKDELPPVPAMWDMAHHYDQCLLSHLYYQELTIEQLQASVSQLLIGQGFTPLPGQT